MLKVQRTLCLIPFAEYRIRGTNFKRTSKEANSLKRNQRTCTNDNFLLILRLQERHVAKLLTISKNLK